MTRMPQLQEMRWGFGDQLVMTRRQAVNATDDDGQRRDGERTYYVYDASGQRVRKVTELADGRRKNERIYLGGYEVFRRYDGNPLVRDTLHVPDGTQRIALVETRVEGDEPGVPPRLIRYQLGNHLGSAVLELDDGAEIISYEEYFPYGGTSYQAVRNLLEAPNRYRYTGKERDEESGFYYHGARYYAPWIGRWTSADPAGLVDGPNLYAYVRNRPVTSRDPNGRQCEDCVEDDLDYFRLPGGGPLIPGASFARRTEREFQERNGRLTILAAGAGVAAAPQAYGLAVSAIVGSSALAAEAIAASATSVAVFEALGFATNVTSFGIGLVTEPGEVPDIPVSPLNPFNLDDVGRGVRVAALGLVDEAIEPLRAAAGNVPRQLTAFAESLQPLRNSIARIEARLTELANAEGAYQAVEAELSGFLGRISPALTLEVAEEVISSLRSRGGYIPGHLKDRPELFVFLDAALTADIGAETLEAAGHEVLQGLSRADRNDLLFRLIGSLRLQDPQTGRPALDVLRELRVLSSRFGRDALAADRTGPRLRRLLDELQLRLDPPTQVR
jgi:RHS repeat-associated protein